MDSQASPIGECRAAPLCSGRPAGTLSVVVGASARESRSRKQEPTPPKPENVMTPDAALERLMEGNTRYQKGVAKRHDFIAEREALVAGQNPYAAIPAARIPKSHRNMRSTADAAISSSFGLPAISPILTRSRVSNSRSKC